ncbi:IS1/IS1595 family N-terminal zinc-binding domain-containing protein [Vibrio profundum]|uniref:IS1/IS1595 family N-terminal zinc-binding domain-containing protein n=1 Tax=Vibrio profundum TaxID=2910247 RepID=UPI003D0D1ADE
MPLAVNVVFCSQTYSVQKHGQHPRGIQRYRCLECKRCFLLNYTAYEALLSANVSTQASQASSQSKKNCMKPSLFIPFSIANF